MKQYVLSAGLASLLIACGGGSSSTTQSAASSSVASSAGTSSSSSATSSSSTSSSTSSSSSSTSSASTASTGVFGNTLCLNADGTGGQPTYALIESAFGTGAIEAPSDSVYTPNRPHVLEYDSDGIVGAHFGILAIDPTDVNLSGSTQDRSRTEIKIAPSTGGVHDAFKGKEGDSYVYAWRFKMASWMKFSSSFTHIHQIKAYNSTGSSPDYSDPPLITITPKVSSGKNVLEVRHVGDLTTSSSIYTNLGSMSLDGLLGQWLDAREEITYSNTAGSYKLTLKDQNGNVVLSINKSGLAMWRTNANHMRPKWGIYRMHKADLNQNIDDYLYLANLAISNSATPNSTCR